MTDVRVGDNACPRLVGSCFVSDLKITRNQIGHGIRVLLWAGNFHFTHFLALAIDVEALICRRQKSE